MIRPPNHSRPIPSPAKKTGRRFPPPPGLNDPTLPTTRFHPGAGIVPPAQKSEETPRNGK